MPVPVSLADLPQLARTASVPGYDRGQLSAGIFHFGVGNFHRSHQSVYLDALMNLGEGHDFAIIGSGVREADKAMHAALRKQDWLTSVVEQDANSASVRITGAMIDFVAPGEGGSILAQLADPAIRIVSLTVTEGGYYIDPASQRFNPDHPDIVADSRTSEPTTVFGLIAAALAARRQAGVPAFTVMSCDNLPHNGEVTRNTVTGVARLMDGSLADWIEAEVAFPSSMVDRITPATSDRERRLLAERFGISDAWPVFCESFKQWVLEDDFPAGRPALEKVGVQFVPDVTPFETMKIRILNGGHASIAYPAGLLDIHFVHEAMAHPLVSAFLRKVETEEIVPTVPPVPHTNLHDYLALCEQRFSNPSIADTVRRLAHDGSNRQPKFIVPSLFDAVADNRPHTGMALICALWCRYCYGVTESGRPIEPNDPIWDRLTVQAKRAKDHPAAWLEMADIYGDLGQHAQFRRTFHDMLNSLWEIGTEATLERYISS